MNENISSSDSEFLLSSGKEIQLSIIGRPNSGKSTLINKIANNNRLLTGPEAGITRDAISSSVEWFGHSFRIFDTAGMRKKSKIRDKLEKLSVSDGIRAIRFSEVIILLIDVNSSFDTQDLKIADLAEREGRCIVIAINKWDLEKKKNQKILELRNSLADMLPQLSGISLVTISGLQGSGLSNLHKHVLLAYKVWNTFPSSVPESYKRYLVNGLRKDFGIIGVPIRLMLRRGSNPFDSKKK